MKKIGPKILDTNFWMQHTSPELVGRFPDYVKLTQEDRDYITARKLNLLVCPIGALLEDRRGEYKVFRGRDYRKLTVASVVQGEYFIDSETAEAWFYSIERIITPDDPNYSLCVHRFLTR
ncbi:MAG: hypothetical protein AAB480_00985 [Patescibacteria group bacterium]